MDKRLMYSMDDIKISFAWLGHYKHGYTELLAFHPKYKPGREKVHRELLN